LEAGGKHSAKEIEEIRFLQQNRCIYCNATFTEILRPTKDHLATVISGGTNWALNIVLACRACNSRRGDIPFRTYCKLLNKSQNHRIALLLAKRLSALNLDRLPDGAFNAFHEGISVHDPKHPRYRLILRTSAIARKNAVRNRVMPGQAHLILRKAMSSGLLVNSSADPAIAWR
jgi:hypothetical protein